eukprot:1539379-Amphidinium_carterae.1
MQHAWLHASDREEKATQPALVSFALPSMCSIKFVGAFGAMLALRHRRCRSLQRTARVPL